MHNCTKCGNADNIEHLAKRAYPELGFARQVDVGTSNGTGIILLDGVQLLTATVSIHLPGVLAAEHLQQGKANSDLCPPLI